MRYLQLKEGGREVYINPDQVKAVVQLHNGEIRIRYGTDNYYDFPAGSYESICSQLNVQGGRNVLKDIKAYISENRSTIYTVLFVLALDQFFFEGGISGTPQTGDFQHAQDR